MTQSKKSSSSGVKITQNPGGNSNFSLSWGHYEEPVKKNFKNPEQNTPTKVQPEKLNSEVNNLNDKTVQQAGGSPKKTIKVVNPPGGKSSFTFG